MAATKWAASAMPSQNGITALVTGANSGIGFQTALELARVGAHVFLGCRSHDKGQQAIARLRQAVPTAQVTALVLDLASLTSIRAAADQFRASDRPLDLLINNAGVMAVPSRELTADGFERQFGTNHLGHFALTGLLLPALLKAQAPRVVTVSSLAHRNGRLNFDDLQGERHYRPWAAYSNSKLANILFARELDRRAREAGSALLSLAAHPGVSRTNIFTGTRDLRSKLAQLVAPFLFQSDAMGALPTLYAATAPDMQGGQYIGPDGLGEAKGYPIMVQARPQALDEATGRRLWTESEHLTGVTYPPFP